MVSPVCGDCGVGSELRAAKRWADAVVGVGAGDREQAAAWASSVFVPAGGREGESDGVLQRGDGGVSRRLLPALPPADEGGLDGSFTATICAYDWPCQEAVAVMMCESSGHADAENGDNVGLFQINVVAHPSYFRAELLDPETNIKAAFDIWRDGGWTSWSCQP